VREDKQTLNAPPYRQLGVPTSNVRGEGLGKGKEGDRKVEGGREGEGEKGKDDLHLALFLGSGQDSSRHLSKLKLIKRFKQESAYSQTDTHAYARTLPNVLSPLLRGR